MEAAPSGRPAVGSQVALLRECRRDGSCLGKLADGRVGKLLKDDHSERPFLVQCNGAESWFWEGDVGPAVGAGGNSGGPAHAMGHTSCKVCTACFHCTGFGPGCVMARGEGPRPASAGEDCGCGRGESGCAACGKCKGCAASAPCAAGAAAAAAAPVAAAAPSAAPAAAFPASLAPGTMVVRGPTWRWGSQDGGEGTVGYSSTDPDLGWVKVKWPSSGTFAYRYSPSENLFDVVPVAGGAPTRPKVGDSVRLARDRPEIAGKCLGSVAEGKVGKLVEDDGTAQPFKVAWKTSSSWCACCAPPCTHPPTPHPHHRIARPFFPPLQTLRETWPCAARRPTRRFRGVESR